jgi:hypothetical protein
LIKRARQEAVFMASSLIDRCAESARASLEEAERSSGSVAQRQQLADAMAAVLKYRGELRTAFPAKLDQAVMAALDSAHMEHELPAPVSEAELALMDDAEVLRFVEASRLQQAVMPVVEHALARLDSLMSSALGLPVVRADLNPLRPDVMCSALLQIIDQLLRSPEVRSLWVRHFANPFARELDRLYASVADMLEAQGVEEARYRLKLTEGGPAAPVSLSAAEGRGSRGGGGAGSGWGSVAETAHPEDVPQRAPLIEMAELAQARTAVPHTVMRDFLYRPQWIQEYDEPLPAVYYEAARAQAAAIAAEPADQYNEEAEAQARMLEAALSVVDRPARTVTPQSPLSPRQWGEQASAQARMRTLMDLKTRASKVSQALGLDAVRTLVGQVASDQRVLAPVREAVVALEPALLHTAMAAPRFFGDDSHPARRLIEEVAQRSFKYNDEFTEDFESFMGPVREVVRELSAPTAAPNKQDFAERLQRLQAQWQSIDTEEKQASEPGMQSMRFAQERQTLADKIGWEFGLRSDLEGVPPKVADFLFQDWSLVIAQAQLTAERSQIDPGGYLAVVSDLLWSVKREAALRQPARLFEVVPGVISTLRRGLQMLGKEPAETESFFAALMRYHDPVLRLRRLRSAMGPESKFEQLPADLEMLAFDSDPLPLKPHKPRAAEQPWLGRAERAVTGFHNVESDLLPAIDLARRATDFGPAELADGDLHMTQLAKAGETDAVPPPDSFAPTQSLLTVQEATASLAAQPLDEQSGAGFALPDATSSAAAPAAEPQPEAFKPPPAHLAESEDEMQTRTRATLARLRTGDWVDLRERNTWRRAQLVWSADNGSLFMFVSRGGRAHSMTRRTCEKLIRARYLRPVDASAVVEKALRSLSARQTTSKKTASMHSHAAA